MIRALVLTDGDGDPVVVCRPFVALCIVPSNYDKSGAVRTILRFGAGDTDCLNVKETVQEIASAMRAVDVDEDQKEGSDREREYYGITTVKPRFFASSAMWSAAEPPVSPAPIMTMSAVLGSLAVD